MKRKAEPKEVEVFDFLDKLRESGTTNMWGAAQFIPEAIEVSEQEAKRLHKAWVANYPKNWETEEIDF